MAVSSEFPEKLIGEALLRANSEAIVVCDRNGIIQYWNPGAERIFGHSSAMALGQSLDLIIPERLRARHWEAFHRTMSTGKSRYSEGALLAVPALQKDGSLISIEFTIAAILNDRREPAGIIAVIRDVTNTFEELKALRKQAAASNGRSAAS